MAFSWQQRNLNESARSFILKCENIFGEGSLSKREDKIVGDAKSSNNMILVNKLTDLQRSELVDFFNEIIESAEALSQEAKFLIGENEKADPRRKINKDVLDSIKEISENLPPVSIAMSKSIDSLSSKSSLKEGIKNLSETNSRISAIESQMSTKKHLINVAKSSGKVFLTGGKILLGIAVMVILVIILIYILTSVLTEPITGLI